MLKDKNKKAFNQITPCCCGLARLYNRIKCQGVKIILSLTVIAIVGVFAWLESKPAWEVWASVTGLVQGPGWGKNDIGPYPGSAKGGAKGMKVNNIPVNISKFESALPVSQIAVFYKNCLQEQGWTDLSDKFFEVTGGLSNKSGKKEDYLPPGMDFLMFKKDDKICVIALQRESLAGKSEYMIISSDADKEALQKAVSDYEIKDAPGEDPANFARYPNSKRQLCVEQEDGVSGSAYMYRGAGTVDSQYHFYKSEMESKGWTPDPAMDNVNANSKEKLMNFSRGQENCSVIIQDSQQSSGTETLVIYK